MKILFCTNSLGAVGGLERVTIVKANAFAEIPGNEVVVCYTDKGTYPEDTIHPVSDKVHTIDLGVSFWDLHPLNLKNLIITAPKKFFKLRRRLKQVISESKPDVVITTGSYEKYALATLSPNRLTGHPSVKIREFHFNSNYRKYVSQSGLFRVVEWFEHNFLGRMFDMNYLLTKEDKDKNFHSNSKYDFMHNPCSFFYREIIQTDREDIVVALGRLSAEKNIASLLRIWHRVHERIDGWRLMIVGDGNERAMLTAMCDKLGISDSVSFVGYRKDVSDILSRCRILAMTSKYEGFGLNIIEAMSEGVVPISYRTPYGPADIISDGKDGILVDYMDEEQFAEKLESMMSDRKRIEQMGEAARIRAKDFAVDKIIDMWMKKYRQLLDGRKC